MRLVARSLTDHALGSKLVELMRDPDGVPKLEAERARMRQAFATNARLAGEVERRGRTKLTSWRESLERTSGR